MEVLNIKEAAEYLHIKVSTLHQWCHARKVPYYRAGKKALFNKIELESWLTTKRIKTIEEIRLEAEKKLRG